MCVCARARTQCLCVCVYLCKRILCVCVLCKRICVCVCVCVCAASLGDVYGPSPVLDLEVRSVTMSSVQLQWTAPGDDLDYGTGETTTAVSGHLKHSFTRL